MPCPKGQTTYKYRQKYRSSDYSDDKMLKLRLFKTAEVRPYRVFESHIEGIADECVPY